MEKTDMYTSMYKSNKVTGPTILIKIWNIIIETTILNYTQKPIIVSIIITSKLALILK